MYGNLTNEQEAVVTKYLTEECGIEKDSKTIEKILSDDFDAKTFYDFATKHQKMDAVSVHEYLMYD